MANRPSERVWVVQGTIPVNEGGTVFEVDPEEVAQVAVDVSTVLRMVGGVAQCGVERVEIAKGVFVTAAMWWKWHSFAPQVKREEQPQQAPAQPPVQQAQPLQVAPEPQEPPPAEADPGVYDPEEFVPLSEEAKRDLLNEGVPVQ